jgi:hypothetical protein
LLSFDFQSADLGWIVDLFLTTNEFGLARSASPMDSEGSSVSVSIQFNRQAKISLLQRVRA